jgi:uncharacterized protein YndB with AHSA1/START domain
MTSANTSDTIVQEITIKAPAARVFAALSSPDQLMKWWGQEGRFQVTRAEIDLRAGGKWLMSGTGMGGRPFTVSGVYRAVEPPRLLVLTWRPTWQGDDTESLVRWDLQETDGATLVRLTHSGLVTEGARNSHRGWPQILAWLQAYAEVQTAA